MSAREQRRVVSLRWIASRKGPITALQLAQIKAWIDADWESHDIDRDARKLIQRLAIELWDAKFARGSALPVNPELDRRAEAALAKHAAKRQRRKLGAKS